MTSFASLGIRIDASDAKVAEKSLNDLANTSTSASQRITAGMSSASSAVQIAAQAMQRSTGSITDAMSGAASRTQIEARRIADSLRESSTQSRASMQSMAESMVVNLNSINQSLSNLQTSTLSQVSAQNSLAESSRNAASSHDMHSMSLGNLAIKMATMMAVYRGINIVAGLPKDIFDTNVEMEKLKVRLEGVTGSVAGAKAEFQRMLELDLKTPFDIQGLTNTVIQLKNYGFNPTNDAMKAFTDGVSKLGGGTSELIGITRQFGQAWAKEKLQLQDMRPMIERGLPVISLLGQALGKTAGQVLEMSKAGTIGHEEMSKLLDAIERWAPDASLRAMDTMYGSLSNVKTAWIQLSDTMMQDKSEGFFKNVFEGWSAMLFALKEHIDSTNTSAQQMIDLQKKINNAQLYLNLKKENPVLAPVIASFSKGIDVTTQEDLDMLLDKQFSLQKMAEIQKRNSESTKSNSESDMKALDEFSDKQLKASAKAVDAQERYQLAAIKAANSVIDAQIEQIKISENIEKDAINVKKNAIEELH
ncbi:MAG: tape measure protein, partial [Candidatus Woesearchaeota archaeon]